MQVSGWTYNLKGELLRAPEMGEVERFTPEDMRLRSIAVSTWGPLIFVNLDGKAAPLAEYLEDIPARVAQFGCESMRYVMRKEYELACNWKVYVDNCQTVQRNLRSRVYDRGRYSAARENGVHSFSFAAARVPDLT